MTEEKQENIEVTQDVSQVQNKQTNLEPSKSESVEQSKNNNRAVSADAAVKEEKGAHPGNARGQKKFPNSKSEFQKEEDSGFIEKVISINRITKVTKGGKKLSFSALVVVGDTKGNVGYSLSKAAEVATAIRKAMGTAKKNMVRIPMKGSTITHEIIGRCGGARVLLKPASEGTGVIASGPVRAVCDGAGIHNILTKCHRSNNAVNVVRATIEALKNLKTKDHYADLRK